MIMTMDGVLFDLPVIELTPAQENWGMLGHNNIVGMLRRQLTNPQNSGGVGHAYLFTGMSGVGRRSLALRFAQALNCTAPLMAGIPCGKCRSCTQIDLMKHPDLHILQAGQEGGTLKVEQVRELQHSLALAPYEARYRVGLLLRFEEANPSAANALLKNLEEPPPQVILLLTASNVETLLPTIVSRCQVMRLGLVPAATIAAGLQANAGVEEEEAHRLARLCGGRPGYALRMLQNPEILEQRRHWMDELLRMLSASRVERFAFAQATADFRAKDADKRLSMQNELRAMLLTWLSFGRDVFLCSTGVQPDAESLNNPDYKEEIMRISNKSDPASAGRFVLLLERTLLRLERNVNARLAVEGLFVDFPVLR